MTKQIDELMASIEETIDVNTVFELEALRGLLEAALKQKDCQITELEELLDASATATRSHLEAALGQPQSVPMSALKPGEPFGYVSEHNCTGSFEYQFHKEQRTIYTDNCRAIHKVYTAAPPAQTPDVGLDFEAWAKAYSTLSLERDSEGVYVDMNQEMLWHAFQAGAKA